MGKSTSKKKVGLKKPGRLPYVAGGDMVVDERKLLNRPDGREKVQTYLTFPGGSKLAIGDPADFRLHERTYGYRTGSLASYDDPVLLLQSQQEAAKSHDRYDLGHPFWNTKAYFECSHINANIATGAGPGGISFQGELRPSTIPIYQASDIATYMAPSELDVNLYGNRAISKIAPTVPRANIAQTLAEIKREGVELPYTKFADLLQSRTTLARTIGGEYLNVVFGWSPLVSDLIAIINSMLNATKIINQYYRDSGLVVRRGLSFPVKRSSTDSTTNGVINVGGGANVGGDPAYYASGNGTVPINKYSFVQENIWFRGAFMYTIGTDNSALGRLKDFEQLGNLLLGTRITPSVLWELTPWSWLVDWGIEIENSVKSAQLLNSDQLVMRYAYLMRTTLRKEVYTAKGPNFHSMPSKPDISFSLVYKKQERVKGTPFGFGVDLGSLTAGQIAILGALGLSKAPGILGP